MSDYNSILVCTINNIKVITAITRLHLAVSTIMSISILCHVTISLLMDKNI